MLQKARMIRMGVGLLVGLVSLTGCQTTPEVITRVEQYDGTDAQLRRLYAEHHCPLVLIGKGIYLPAPSCLCKESKGGGAVTPPESEKGPTNLPAVAVPTQTDQPPPESAGAGQSEEGRKLGGYAEERVLGGGTLPIRCVKRWDCSGFEVLVPAGGDIQYFDGQLLRDAKDRFVPIR